MEPALPMDSASACAVGSVHTVNPCGASSSDGSHDAVSPQLSAAKCHNTSEIDNGSRTPEETMAATNGGSQKPDDSADPAEMMPPTASLWLVLMLNLVAVTNLLIVIPTADDYSSRLGGGQMFSGLLVSLAPFFTVFGVIAQQSMLSCMSMRTAMFMLVFLSIIGNVLYALAGLTRSPWSLLVARAIIGFSAVMYGPLYISLTVGIKKRSRVMLMFSTCGSSAYSLAPLLAALLEWFLKEIRVENLVLDADTAPGWLLSIVYFVLLLLVFTIFQSPTMPDVSQGRRAHVVDNLKSLPIVALVVTWLVLLLVTLVQAMAEVYVTKLAEQYWGWSVGEAGMYMALVMAFVVPISIGASCVAQMIEDRKGIFIMCLLATISSWTFYDFGIEDEFGRAFLTGGGCVLVFGCASIARAFALALITKLVPPESKATLSTIAMATSALARGLGSLVGALMEPGFYALVSIGIFAVVLATVGLNYKQMSPIEEARKHR